MLHFTQHASKQYEQALNGLLASLLAMGEKARGMIAHAGAALTGAPDQAPAAKALDKEINALETQVEQQVTALLTRHAMMADELRFVLCAIRIASHLERVGDMAKNTVKRIGKMPVPIPKELQANYAAMAKSTDAMVAQAIGLIENYNQETALSVCRSDDEVDGRYKDIVLAAQRAVPAEALAPFLFLAKNLERMADYASSVAKEAAYIHTGQKLVVS